MILNFPSPSQNPLPASLSQRYANTMTARKAAGVRKMAGGAGTEQRGKVKMKVKAQNLDPHFLL